MGVHPLGEKRPRGGQARDGNSTSKGTEAGRDGPTFEMKTDKAGSPCGCPLQPLPHVWSLSVGPCCGQPRLQKQPMGAQSKHPRKGPHPRQLEDGRYPWPLGWSNTKPCFIPFPRSPQGDRAPGAWNDACSEKHLILVHASRVPPLEPSGFLRICLHQAT